MAEEEFPTDIASSGEPYMVGIMPTEDGDKVILVIRAEQKDQVVLWLEIASAKTLAEALSVTACRIEAEGKDKPPQPN
jgi:hypothetical protein